ncbi:MAG: hypothetical protein ACHQIL_06560 [Steroidobacterales bacterium]
MLQFGYSEKRLCAQSQLRYVKSVREKARQNAALAGACGVLSNAAPLFCDGVLDLVPDHMHSSAGPGELRTLGNPDLALLVDGGKEIDIHALE